nr:uncharacterized protein LOC123774306 [Procambarus clarkii]
MKMVGTEVLLKMLGVLLGASLSLVRGLALYIDGNQPYLPVKTPFDSRMSNLPEVDRQQKERSKRSAVLVWPEGSLFVAEFYFEIPIKAPSGLDIPFTIDVPYEFTLPNITAKSDYLSRNINQADDRLGLYGIMEGIFNKFGMDGKACLMRAVCEGSQSSLLRAGMLGEVITTILTASLSTSLAEMKDYVEAEEYGRSHGDCQAMFPTCSISIFRFLE